MLKILQARLQQYVNWELPDVQVGFRKGRGARDQMPTSTGSWKKQENSRKTSTSASLATLNPLTVWITINCGKFFKSWEYHTTLPTSWEICRQVKKQQLELDIEHWFKLGKEYVKAVYCHHAYLTYKQSTSCKMPGWWSTSWNQDYWEKYQLTQICRWHHPYGRNWRGTKQW